MLHTFLVREPLERIVQYPKDGVPQVDSKPARLGGPQEAVVWRQGYARE